MPGYGWFFYVITWAGSPLSVTIAASLAFILGKNKLKVFAAILVVGLIFGILVTGDIKELAKRPRPAGEEAAILLENSYSFPSGHALSIFIMASMLGAYYGWKYRIAGYVIALTVSLSRLYLNVHYPTDVLAGAVLGIILGEVLAYAAYRFGLCDNAGLLSLLYEPPVPPSGAYMPVKTSLTRISSLAAFLAATTSVVMYYLNHPAIAVIVPSIALMLIILDLLLAGITFSNKLMAAFIFISIGLIAALSMFFLQAYVMSLAMIALTFVVCLSLTCQRISAIFNEK